MSNDPIVMAGVARPGDTLIIGFNRPVADEEIGWMEETFRPLIDQGIQVMFADQVSSMVIFRPGEEVDINGARMGRRVTLEGYDTPGER